jgi:hypothetical protein
MKLTRENRSTCPIASLSTTNATMTRLEMISNLRSRRQATNGPGHSRDLERSGSYGSYLF